MVATGGTFNTNQYLVVSTGTTTTNTIVVTGGGGWQPITSSGYYDYPVVTREVEAPVLLLKGKSYKMPNGAVCHIDDVGGFRIDDKNAKVIYRATRIHDFNPFLNASDLLEEYIRELVPHGIRQDEVLRIPIESFIFWLVHKAAEKDNEPAPTEIPRLPNIKMRCLNRCGLCGRFVSDAYARQRIYFCSPRHMSEKLRRLDLCGQ